MAGSLYFSEVAHFVPCRLCWYQRIAMYPLVLLLGIATLRRDVGIRLYAIPLAAIGAAVSIYHVQLERFPDQAHVLLARGALQPPPRRAVRLRHPGGDGAVRLRRDHRPAGDRPPAAPVAGPDGGARPERRSCDRRQPVAPPGTPDKELVR